MNCTLMRPLAQSQIFNVLFNIVQHFHTASTSTSTPACCVSQATTTPSTSSTSNTLPPTTHLQIPPIPHQTPPILSQLPPIPPSHPLIHPLLKTLPNRNLPLFLLSFPTISHPHGVLLSSTSTPLPRSSAASHPTHPHLLPPPPHPITS